MITRREMLKRSALLSLAPVVPTFWAQAARAAAADKDRRVLVVIQLDGGNDGLNTVVPMRDENYAKLRPKLKLDPKNLIKLNDDVGLHSALRSAGKLFDAGRLAIVQGVGYPNPNRSHFESMATWHSARLDQAEHGQFGWLGRALDVDAAPQNSPQAILVGGGSVPVALWGRKSTAATIKSLDELAMNAPADLLREAIAADGNSSELARFVSGTCQDAFSSAQRITTAMTAGGDGNARSAKVTYPESALAAQLKLVSALIQSGSHARVFYTIQGGYDTHSNQSDDHFQLLSRLSAALGTFINDLEAAGLADRVLVLAFSEFGRRAAENASEGTDHGAAAPVFLAGTQLAGGIVGPTPNLADLQDGDVKMTIDFRQVFATILDGWLDVRPGLVLPAAFEQLPLFKT